MALPILESPKYSVRLPSTGKTVEFRPFLVKEEKVLLIAQESGESRQMLTAMKEIIKACTFETIVPNDLTAYDLEYLFLQLRSKSVGETSTVKIKCSSCETYTPVEINLDDVGVPVVSHEPVNIMLSDTIGITMRHIRVRDLGSLTDEKKAKGDLFTDTIIASIATIFDATAVYPTDESKKEELVRFVGSLNRAQIKQIEEFIATTPKVEVVAKFKCGCEKCQADNEVKLTGIQSFFG
jgi:hypothetical protein